MHSGFQIPDSGHNHHIIPPENSCAAVLLSTNQTQILEEIHGGTLHQPLSSRLNHQYPGAAVSSSFFRVNLLKLGNLNEICTSNYDSDSNYTVKCINEGEDAFLCGSEQYEVPDARHSNLLGIPHCWQNQEHSAVKQPWEALPQEASNNENSEIVGREEHQEMNQKDALTNCLESKSRVPFGELEAIYKLLDTSMSNQTGPSENFTSNPMQSNHEEAPEIITKAKRKRRKKRKEMTYNNDEVIDHVAQFFEGLMKLVIDHQENLHKKVAEVIERLDEERRERDENWKKQESAYFKQEAEARAMEKASAESREATIVSCLEKITGQRIRFST